LAPHFLSDPPPETLAAIFSTDTPFRIFPDTPPHAPPFDPAARLEGVTVAGATVFNVLLKTKSEFPYLFREIIEGSLSSTPPLEINFSTPPTVADARVALAERLGLGEGGAPFLRLREVSFNEEPLGIFAQGPLRRGVYAGLRTVGFRKLEQPEEKVDDNQIVVRYAHFSRI
jgi:hypothetical protein